MMRQIDFSPFYRTSVGFDRIFAALEELGGAGTSSTYPPYNIQKTASDRYRITLAVAGFDQTSISIELDDGTLTIRGRHDTNTSDNDVETLFQGIASRNFERRFQLAEHVQVIGADLENGLLHVNLERIIPEDRKARKIPIGIKTVDSIDPHPTVS